MESHHSGSFPPSPNQYWTSNSIQPTYSAADRVIDWRNTARFPLSPISTNLGSTSQTSEPFTQQYNNFSSSACSTRGYTPLKPYHRPSLDSAPILAPGESPPPRLSTLPPPQLNQSTVLAHPIACSSCDTVLPNSDDSQHSVELFPCGHPICSTCLTLLINSAANVPPRPVDCFLCGEPVQTFAGLRFSSEVVVAEERGFKAGRVTPSKTIKDEYADEGFYSSSLPPSSGSHFGLTSLTIDGPRDGENSPPTPEDKFRSGGPR